MIKMRKIENHTIPFVDNLLYDWRIGRWVEGGINVYYTKNLAPQALAKWRAQGAPTPHTVLDGQTVRIAKLSGIRPVMDNGGLIMAAYEDYVWVLDNKRWYYVDWLRQATAVPETRLAECIELRGWVAAGYPLP